MTQALKIPTAARLAEAWTPVYKLLGFGKVQTARDYARAIRVMDEIVDEIGDNEKHPMGALLDYLAEQVKDYEERTFPMPPAEPHKVLRFLIESHGLKQSEIEGIPQSIVSAMLSGKRSISKAAAKILANRFKVDASVFL